MKPRHRQPSTPQTGDDRSRELRGQLYPNLEDAPLLAQCEVHTYRSSGPGGQKKNKTSSAVRLHHRPSGLIAKAEEDRSQHVNKARALKRLRLLIATELLAKIDVQSYAPSARLASCMHDGRLELRLKDERALGVINEVLSVLAGRGGHVRDAAQDIGVSTANLVKFLHIDSHVWRKVNHIRQAHGFEPLTSRS